MAKAEPLRLPDGSINHKRISQLLGGSRYTSIAGGVSGMRSIALVRKQIKQPIKSQAMKRILIATEAENLTEALYIDGTLHQSSETIYASEIAAATNGKPCTIAHREVVTCGEFPSDESDLIDE